jgi:predicted ATPase
MQNNNWYVVTGGPCSGKTTTLELIEKMGYRVEYEQARLLIDNEMKKGRVLEEIRKDEYLFQKKVLEMKIKLEDELPKDQLIFIERGIPDSTAYYEKLCSVKRKDDAFLESSLMRSKYKKVFLFELLDYKKDYARVENSDEAKSLELALERSYTELGIEVVRVPPMSVKERIKFILVRLD